MTLTLPFPVSANRYWRNVRGRMVVSAEAKAYKEQAGWMAKAAGITPADGPVRLTLRFFRPRKAGDLDNYIKVALDALNGVAYQDDKQVVEIHAYRGDDKTNPRVEIEILEITA